MKASMGHWRTASHRLAEGFGGDLGPYAQTPTAQNSKDLSGIRPGTLPKTQIPIRSHHWDEPQPGFVDANTVAHCGNSLIGDFVWSLTMTDTCAYNAVFFNFLWPLASGDSAWCRTETSGR